MPQLTKSPHKKISKSENSQYVDQYFFLPIKEYKKSKRIALAQVGDYIIITFAVKTKQVKQAIQQWFATFSSPRIPFSFLKDPCFKIFYQQQQQNPKPKHKPLHLKVTFFLFLLTKEIYNCQSELLNPITKLVLSYCIVKIIAKYKETHAALVSIKVILVDFLKY